MQRLLCLTTLAVATALINPVAAQQENRGGPPSNPATELRRLQQELRRLSATVKDLEDKLAKLEQAQQRGPAAFSTARGSFGGGGFGGGFGAGPGGASPFGGVARVVPRGEGRPEGGATSRSGPPRPGPDGPPRVRERVDLDRRLDRIVQELEQLRRELRRPPQD